MFEQQEFEYYMRPSNALRRYNGCRTLAFIGIYLLCMSLLLYQLSGGTYMRLPYTEDDLSFIFRLQNDQTGPIAVYVYLDNFYSNVRQYLDDSPNQITFKEKCDNVNTVGDVQLIRSPASFPEVDFTNSSSIFEPCGLQSATFFDDYLEFESVVCRNTCERKTYAEVERVEAACCANLLNGPKIPILADVINAPDTFPLFAVPGHEKQWTNLVTDTRAQSWYSKPFVNKRMIFIGMLSTYKLSSGYYKITFLRNVWPAKEWNTNKEVILANFGALGSKQDTLLWLCAVWGLALLGISLLFYWAVRRDIVFLSDTMAEIPADEIQNQWIQHAKGWKATS